MASRCVLLSEPGLPCTDNVVRRLGEVAGFTLGRVQSLCPKVSPFTDSMALLAVEQPTTRKAHEELPPYD